MGEIDGFNQGLGALVWWTLRGVRVKRADMRAAFEAQGLGAAVPRDPRPTALLTRACREALLGDEYHELLLLQRLTERAALQYELRGRETRVEGPIILLIDESGSMVGTKDEWAKGVAMALCEIAARQKRAFAVVHFDTKVSRVDRFDDPTKLDFASLIGMLTWFTGGGTRLAAALESGLGIVREAREKNEKIKRADLVMISDGVDYDFDAQASILAQCKQEGVSTYGIGIADDFAEELKQHMANVVFLDTCELNGPSSKLNHVFSI